MTERINRGRKRTYAPKLTAARLVRLACQIGTVKEVAEVAKIPYQTYSTWESGQRGFFLSEAEIGRLADCLEVGTRDIADKNGVALLAQIPDVRALIKRYPD